MINLLVVSLVWAFSFGLIKGRLTGLDLTAVAAVRLAFAVVVFLPFLRWRKIDGLTALKLAVTGAVQFGAMYMLYLQSFHYLQAFEVALFTIFTPLYLTLIDALLQQRVAPIHWGAAALSVAGAGVVLWPSQFGHGLWVGFGLVQLSNLCFAFGQLAYRRIRSTHTGQFSDAQGFALLYAAALLLTLLVSLRTTDWRNFHPDASQWLVLAYLGLVASGLCFFWWNTGARQVNAGALAVWNNAKVPLGVACSLWFFHEKSDSLRLLIGGTLLVLAVILVQRKEPRAESAKPQ